MTIHRVGYGIGHRDGPIPNVLRVCLGRMDPGLTGESGDLTVLEATIDDMNPECYDLALERLLVAGASDVWLTPALMKKNRPGVVLSVLCQPVLAPALSELLLIETTTLGVRRYAVTRTALDRAIMPIETRYGTVAVKTALHHGRPLRCKP